MADVEVAAELRATNERLDRIIALLEANMETPEYAKIKAEIQRKWLETYYDIKNTENE